MKQARVLHSDPPRRPKRLDYALIFLMRPRIVSEILPFLPVSLLLPLVPPASSFAPVPWFDRRSIELVDIEVALDLSEFPGFFHANDFVSKVERV